MDGSRRIAIVGLRSLEALGLRSILHNISGVASDTFGSFEEFKPLSESADAFVVSAEVFAMNLDFFLPKKQKTIVVADVYGASSREGFPKVISRDSDEAEIENAVVSLVGSLGNGAEPPGELSQREREVLVLIAAGKLNKEIADILCISVNTVITHRKNISSKLGIKSASGLSLYAMMNGLI